MKKMYLAMERELVVASQKNGTWQVSHHLEGMQPMCLAKDPFSPERLYCGTFARGMWRSTDAGSSWRPVGDPSHSRRPPSIGSIAHPNIMAVAVSSTEYSNGYGVVYAGTEPSALFRSEDGGDTWRELKTLKELPSAPTWSFPPRPYTSHVRCIVSDPIAEGRMYVAIEAGALVRSFDGGENWEDHKFLAPIDSHTLAIHSLAPGRIYAAAGDGFLKAGTGYAESLDGGESWSRPDEGLRHHYLWGAAIDPVDPDIILVSASVSPERAHNPNNAESRIYRREGSGAWQEVNEGLPEPEGTVASVLASNTAKPHVFYALTNKGLYQSSDAGLSWQKLNVPWHEYYLGQHQQALLVVEE